MKNIAPPSPRPCPESAEANSATRPERHCCRRQTWLLHRAQGNPAPQGDRTSCEPSLAVDRLRVSRLSALDRSSLVLVLILFDSDRSGIKPRALQLTNHDRPFLGGHRPAAPVPDRCPWWANVRLFRTLAHIRQRFGHRIARIIHWKGKRLTIFSNSRFGCPLT